MTNNKLDPYPDDGCVLIGLEIHLHGQRFVADKIAQLMRAHCPIIESLIEKHHLGAEYDSCVIEYSTIRRAA